VSTVREWEREGTVGSEREKEMPEGRSDAMGTNGEEKKEH